MLADGIEGRLHLLEGAPAGDCEGKAGFRQLESYAQADAAGASGN